MYEWVDLPSRGFSKHPMYKTWIGMKYRCYNPHAANYSSYGGRGIVVCDEWKNDFKAFYKWAIDNGWKFDLTIERIDVNGNYSPENCKWSTAKDQANNRRSNITLTYKGETKTIAQWSEIVKINHQTIRQRLRNGWDVEKTLTTPPDVSKRKK